MNEKILTEVVEKSSSDLILFFVIIAVIIIAIIAIAVPFFKLLARKEAQKMAAETTRIKAEAEADNSKLDKYIKREDRIIQVVQDNTRAITTLSSILESNNKNCDECRTDQYGLWKKIDDDVTYIKHKIDTEIEIKAKERVS